MRAKVEQTKVRFETKRDKETMRRAAKLLRVSANRFMTDAILEKAKLILQPQTSTAAD